MEGFLLEHNNLKVDAPVDLNTAAFAGSRVSLAGGERLAIIVNMGDSTAAVVDFTLKQHTAASAGSSKVLAVANKYFHKVGAATVFTQVEPTSEASNYVLSSLLSDEPGVVVFEVLASQLDVNNGYAYVSIEAADSTAAKLAGFTYVLRQPTQKPPYGIAL